jgi:DNA-binding transcriptional ArsR family regulator
VTALTWSVLGDPRRRAILDVLRQTPCDVTGLIDAVRLSQSATSKHLRVLRDAGLVLVTPAGQRRIYSVVPAPLMELDEWLAPYRAMWNTSLDSLGSYLDTKET